MLGTLRNWWGLWAGGLLVFNDFFLNHPFFYKVQEMVNIKITIKINMKEFFNILTFLFMHSQQNTVNPYVFIIFFSHTIHIQTLKKKIIKLLNLSFLFQYCPLHFFFSNLFWFINLKHVIIPFSLNLHFNFSLSLLLTSSWMGLRINL